jgi:phage terminase small subunit
VETRFECGGYGAVIQSPYGAIANRQTEIMMRIAAEFGFTPASRSRISRPTNPEPTLFELISEKPETKFAAAPGLTNQRRHEEQ